MDIWYLVTDCGDGHSTVVFFKSAEVAEKVWLEKEGFWINEGGPNKFTADNVKGIRFSDDNYEFEEEDTGD